MRRTLLLCTLPLAWIGSFSCSGGNTTIDAGQDVAPQDVAIEYYKAETAPPTPTIIQLAAGAQHTCMLISYGQQYVTYCFGLATALGATAQGILAVPTNGTNATMQPSLLTIASSHGAGHTCGIDTQHQVWCWGDNTAGQCGQGNIETPVMAPELSLDSQFGITQAKPGLIAAGTSTTCVVRPLDGKLECFGDNTSCESDLYDMTGCSQNPEISTLTTDTDVVFTNLTLLSQGDVHGCVAASPYPTGNASLFCYGDNAFLESGPTGKAITTPADNIAPPTSIISLSTGDAHTCFVTNSPHQLYCFGKNDMHQASPTSTTTPIDPTTIAPIALPGGATPYTVGVRSAESCVADTDGNLWCFGMGHGTNIDAVTGLKNVGEIAVGGAHTCAVANLPTDPANAPASVLCWGDNTNGQAGQPAGGTIATPTAVVIPQSAP
jgi:alpha-tubulin suppressor-like RCC1 family protein